MVVIPGGVLEYLCIQSVHLGISMETAAILVNSFHRPYSVYINFGTRLLCYDIIMQMLYVS